MVKRVDMRSEDWSPSETMRPRGGAVAGVRDRLPDCRGGEVGRWFRKTQSALAGGTTWVRATARSIFTKTNQHV